MIEQIQSQFIKIVLKYLEKYGQEKSQSADNVQLILGFKEVELEVEVNGEKVKRVTYQNTYHVCVNYVVKDERVINEIMGLSKYVPDILGRGRMSEAFIIKALLNFAQENESLDVKVMCVKGVDEETGKDTIKLFLYKGFSQFIKKLESEDVFKQEYLAEILQM
jgi:hypothetical protein